MRHLNEDQLLSLELEARRRGLMPDDALHLIEVYRDALGVLAEQGRDLNDTREPRWWERP